MTQPCDPRALESRPRRVPARETVLPLRSDDAGRDPGRGEPAVTSPQWLVAHYLALIGFVLADGSEADYPPLPLP